VLGAITVTARSSPQITDMTDAENRAAADRFDFLPVRAIERAR
jgi:hypothetical protein